MMAYLWQAIGDGLKSQSNFSNINHITSDNINVKLRSQLNHQIIKWINSWINIAVQSRGAEF